MQELCAQLAHMTNECEVYELDLSQLIPVTMSLSFGVLGKLHTHHRAFKKKNIDLNELRSQGPVLAQTPTEKGRQRLKQQQHSLLLGWRGQERRSKSLNCPSADCAVF